MTVEQLSPDIERLIEQRVREALGNSEQMQATIAALVQERLAAEFGLPGMGDIQRRSWPATAEQKLTQMAKQMGGAWHPQLGSRYVECRCRDKLACAKHWTEDKEHRWKFALGMCECQPPQGEPITAPQSATRDGDTFRTFQGDVTNPREPLRKTRRGEDQ